ncbi:hypothetical protein TWF970_007609 [Orbilia oligospora]|uniref:Cytochrome P450 n=1 Tax=Orbilia oligospora TaxID=2813651 RepID=A0A7C8VBP3_ORBOL|nr:hypothetical protein TWF970_007609 [Orbilia oligospora]
MILLNFISSEIDTSRFVAVTAVLAIGYFLANAIYQLYFSPLSKVPGPWYAAISPIFFIIVSLKGNAVYTWELLHVKYGPYLRVSPTSVMVADRESALKVHSPNDVFPKGPWYTNAMASESILTIRDHQKYKTRRKAFGSGFSKSNMALLEPVVRKKAELCFKKIGKHFDNGDIVDVKPWLYWMAADIVGELCFGKDFGMLENEAENLLVRDCLNFTLVAGIQAQAPFTKYIIWLLYGSEALADLQHEVQNCKDGNPRPSLFSHLLKDVDNPNAKYKVNITELRNESTLFILAGTDTTATVATFLAWDLFRNADIRQKVIVELKEIGWTQGDNDDGITDEKLQTLPYLGYLLREALRLYTPAHTGFPRVVPENGRYLGPHFLPAGTECLLPVYTLHRDPNIFDEPFAFKPERWLNPSREMESVIMAFGGASRVCTGQHLAMMELRLSVAMMLKYWGNAELADSCTDESMEIVERFLIHPKGNKLEIQNKKITLEN